ncbi:hypothetical protein CHU98_g10652 [Xylaria longipes]|nr:hypothetical protein CHU98_g10652 [Xylaria longipes]
MKSLQLSVLALLLNAGTLEAKVFRKNIPTFEVLPGAKITNNKIEYDDPDCDAGLDCHTAKTCSITGFVPSLTADKKYFACCATGQRLLGSADTAFDCCADGHHLVGGPDTGYYCCEIGFTWDGQQCKKVCQNGKSLVNGKCACPEGTMEGSDGTCKETSKPTAGKCSSGLEFGNYYGATWFGTGFGYAYYSAAETSLYRLAKLQLCANEKCDITGELNPSDKVYIRDLWGDLGSGVNNRQWLNNYANGAHIIHTPTFADAGTFAISKWLCGKYCLGGFTQGFGPACPTAENAFTFFSLDPEMCVAFEFHEVPCSLKNDANNCIWTGGDQCSKKEGKYLDGF